jgi:cobalt-zinc-cadmium resistance protein CzcA
MLNRLIQAALSQRLLMLMLVVLLGAAGSIAFRALPIDAYPDISPSQVKIIIKAPGMTPEEVEARITQPIEVELLGIPKQTMLRSVAKYSLTDITLDFREGTDIYWARQQVAERLNAVWNDLPDGISGGLAPMSTPLSDMFMFTIEAPALSLNERRHLLDWVIRPALRTVPGVADINALGGFVNAWEVVPNSNALAALGIPLGDLLNALEKNNRNDGAGRLRQDSEVILVRTEGQMKNGNDIAGTVIAMRNGTPIRIGDVATVRIGSMTRYGVVTHDGKGEAVEGLVLGLRGANARDVITGVRQKLDELQPALPKGVAIVPFYDRSNLIDRAVGTVSKALIEAIVLVLVLLALFLGDARAAITVAVILPLSALVTFIAMQWLGLSANLMSLGGLAIAIGMLVDAAVVVVENVVRQLSEPGSDRLPRLHLIYRATAEVAVPVTSGIAIIIIVFLPLLSLQGLEGKLFAPVAITIVLALLGSLLLSLTVIPVIASFLLKGGHEHEPWLPRTLAARYRPLLHRALNNDRVVIGSAVTALVLTALVFTQIGKSFMPTMDEGDVLLQVEKIPSISLEASRDIDLHIQQALLRAVPEIKHIVARAGSDELGMDPMGLNETDTFLELQPREKWQVKDKDALLEKIRGVMTQFPGINYGFTQPIDMRVSEMLTGSRGDIAIKLFGPDLDVLNEKGAQIAAVLEKIAGSSDIFASLNAGVQYLTVQIRRDRVGQFGLDVEQFEALLRSQIEGTQAGVILDRGARIPILVRYPLTTHADIDNFRTQLIALPDGRSISLEAVADVRRTEGPVLVARERGRRFMVVRTNVEGRDLVGFVEEAQAAIAQQIKLPSGYSLQWGGQFENQRRAAARLAVVVPVALMLVFLLLFSTFGSLRQVLLVLSTIPFAMIGGVFALWLTGEYLSVPASVGFIALLGIAVLNGVVLVGYFNQLLARGLPPLTVVTEGATRRLRPVLMTASIAALGLVPLLFASGPGSEIQRPLAIVVIGGLLSSTALTLFLLPIFYLRFGMRDAR